MEDQVSKVAVLIGDPVRSKVLWALLDGRAYTATELAVYTGTTAQNLSMHLTKLLDGGLLMSEKQGRHRYYSFARPEVANVIEGLASLCPPEAIRKEQKTEVPVQYCRSCYDHLAGKVGVLFTERLLEKNYLQKDGEDFQLTAAGEQWLTDNAIDITIQASKRRFARVCLDWSERKHHLAGALGAALLQHMLDSGWLRRTDNSRAIVVTRKGREALQEQLGLAV